MLPLSKHVESLSKRNPEKALAIAENMYCGAMRAALSKTYTSTALESKCWQVVNKWFKLFNRCYDLAKKAEKKAVEPVAPKVGMGATLHYPQDKYPYVVETCTSKTASLRRLLEVGLSTGHHPKDHHNGFPVWDHTYTDEEIAMNKVSGPVLLKVSLRKNGTWQVVGGQNGAVVTFGTARYYRDYSY